MSSQSADMSSPRTTSRLRPAEKRLHSPLAPLNTSSPIPPSLVGKLIHMRSVETNTPVSSSPQSAELWLDRAEYSTPNSLHESRHYRRNMLPTTSPVDAIPPPFPIPAAHIQQQRLPFPTLPPSRPLPCRSAPVQSYDLHLYHAVETVPPGAPKFDHARASRMAEVTRWRA